MSLIAFEGPDSAQITELMAAVAEACDGLIIYTPSLTLAETPAEAAATLGALRPDITAAQSQGKHVLVTNYSPALYVRWPDQAFEVAVGLVDAAVLGYTTAFFVTPALTMPDDDPEDVYRQLAVDDPDHTFLLDSMQPVLELLNQVLRLAKLPPSRKQVAEADRRMYSLERTPLIDRADRRFSTRAAAEAFLGFGLPHWTEALFRQPPLDQRSTAWHLYRQNKHTGSRAGQGAGRLKARHYHQAPLTSAEAASEHSRRCNPYSNQEQLFRELTEKLGQAFQSNYFMKRGTALEDEAARAFEEIMAEAGRGGWRIIDFGLTQHHLLYTPKSQGGLMPDHYVGHELQWQTFFNLGAGSDDEGQAETIRALEELEANSSPGMEVNGVDLDDWIRIKELRWMAYSPDGLLAHPDGMVALLEIKAPVSWPTRAKGEEKGDGYSPAGYSECKMHGPGECDTVPWTHYLAQVQFGMYAMGLPVTYFFQYAPPSFQGPRKACLNMVYPNPVLLGKLIDRGRRLWGDIFQWRKDGTMPEDFALIAEKRAAKGDKPSVKRRRAVIEEPIRVPAGDLV